MNVKTVVLVGHCGADSWSLSSLVQRAAPEVEIVGAGSDRDLQRYANPACLWLVNRNLGGFGVATGVDLIARHAKPDGPVLMLISNYSDAQERAVAAGAKPGFGKDDLHDLETAERLRAALAG